MSRTYEQPTREASTNPHIEDYTERHPAYAVIGASRVSLQPRPSPSSGPTSATRTSSPSGSGPPSCHRGLSNDRVHGGIREYIEGRPERSPVGHLRLDPERRHGRALHAGTPRRGLRARHHAHHRPTRANTGERSARRLQDAVKAIEELRDAAPTKKMRDMAEKALRELTLEPPLRR